MKRIFVFLLCCFAVAMSSSAQGPYTPMLKEGNKWYYHFMVEYPDDVMDAWFDYDIPSSLIKEGRIYYKMRIFESEHFGVNSRTKDAIPRTKNTILSLDLREEYGRVYVDLEQYIAFLYDSENTPVIPGEKIKLSYHVNEDNEIVLYDFNMEVGDKYVHVDGYDDIFVVKTDSIVTQDFKRRKRMILNNGLTIVEGIGCVNSAGGLLNYLNPVRHSDEEHIGVQSGDMKYFQDLKSYPYEDLSVEITPEIIKTDMPSINRQWINAFPENSGSDIMTKLSECTLKEGIYIGLAHFMKVYSREYSLGQPEPEWSKTEFYVGQKGNKVFCYNSSFDEPRLLMDFSLSEGESAVCYRGEGKNVEYVVEAVTDTIMPGSTDQFRRKCLHVRNTADPADTDVWVEGIGSMKFGIACWNISGLASLSTLASCKQGDFVLMEDSTKMTSPILSGIEIPQAPKEYYQDNMNTKFQHKVFLLTGQKASADTPSKGIRIIRYSDGTTKKVYTR